MELPVHQIQEQEQNAEVFDGPVRRVLKEIVEAARSSLHVLVPHVMTHIAEALREQSVGVLVLHVMR